MNSLVVGVSTSQPLSVTSTVSSMRTPPNPVDVGAGLDGDHHPARSLVLSFFLPLRLADRAS